MRRPIRKACAVAAATVALVTAGVAAAAPADAATSYRRVYQHQHVVCVKSSANYSVVWEHHREGGPDLTIRPGQCLTLLELWPSVRNSYWHRIQAGKAPTPTTVTHPSPTASIILRIYGGTFANPIISVHNG